MALCSSVINQDKIFDNDTFIKLMVFFKKIVNMFKNKNEG